MQYALTENHTNPDRIPCYKYQRKNRNYNKLYAGYCIVTIPLATKNGRLDIAARH